MDNESTMTRSKIRLKPDSTFHIKTWYSTPSLSCRDYEVFVDSEEIKTQNKPDLRKDQMKKLADKCHKLRRLDHSFRDL
jgi:hypothetical protein